MKELIVGDCLEILKGREPFVDLVYLDPPFFTQKTHALKNRHTRKQYQFDDTWENLTEYLTFLRERLMLIRQVMQPTATLYFHCDKTASHHIRLLLDEVFGTERFLSEIIWTYKRWSNARRGLMNSHQVIYMYTRSENYTFNTLYQAYSETTNLDQILQRRKRTSDGRVIYARDERDETVFNGVKKGVPLSDTWAIPYLNPKAKERTGYPTQKPLLLLERIIKLSCNPGDVVLDPFCGSGTTVVAAAMLERDYVGIDVLPEAIDLTRSRLANPVKSRSGVLDNGRGAYDNLPDEVKNILAGLPVKIVQRNSGIDALYDTFVAGRPVVIRVQRRDESLRDTAEKLLKAGRKKRAAKMILIQTHTGGGQISFMDNGEVPNDITIIPAVGFLLQNIITENEQKEKIG